MKKISIYMFIAAMFFGAISCEEKLDINTDPLASTIADPTPNLARQANQMAINNYQRGMLDGPYLQPSKK